MVFLDDIQEEEENDWESLLKEIQYEIEKSGKELQEISLMFEQSQLEVNRLAQKNAAVTSQLQRIQGHFDSIPREDIRVIYDDALDSQQRLFVMRGQSEKLQSDQEHLQKYINFLKQKKLIS